MPPTTTDPVTAAVLAEMATAEAALNRALDVLRDAGAEGRPAGVTSRAVDAWNAVAAARRAAER